MLWDLVLFFAALALAAVGAVNLGTAPIWFRPGRRVCCSWARGCHSSAKEERRRRSAS